MRIHQDGVLHDLRSPLPHTRTGPVLAVVTRLQDFKPCGKDSDCASDGRMCCVASPMAKMARGCTKKGCTATYQYNPFTGRVMVCKDPQYAYE